MKSFLRALIMAVCVLTCSVCVFGSASMAGQDGDATAWPPRIVLELQFHYPPGGHHLDQLFGSGRPPDDAEFRPNTPPALGSDREARTVGADRHFCGWRYLALEQGRPTGLFVDLNTALQGRLQHEGPKRTYRNKPDVNPQVYYATRFMKFEERGDGSLHAERVIDQSITRTTKEFLGHRPLPNQNIPSTVKPGKDGIIDFSQFVVKTEPIYETKVVYQASRRAQTAVFRPGSAPNHMLVQTKFRDTGAVEVADKGSFLASSHGPGPVREQRNLSVHMRVLSRSWNEDLAVWRYLLEAQVDETLPPSHDGRKRSHTYRLIGYAPRLPASLPKQPSGTLEEQEFELIPPVMINPSPPDSDVASAFSFRSPNVTATGRISDDKLKWRLRNELDRIQQRYDLIASQVETGRYDQARRNIELLRQALPAAGELVAQVQAGGDACEVVLTGLPTDAAMARIAELERMRAENLRHYHRVQAELTRINDDLFRASTEYINEVWRAMTQNLVEWHSPPDWYEVPKTFKGWHDQSKEQAGKILSRQEVIQNLRLLEKHLRDEMRDVLDRHREEIVEKLDALEPVPELDSLVQSVVCQVDWARWTPGDRGKCTTTALR